MALQIWFQNRRQSSRRKSRPLLPHEIAQYQLARSATSPADDLDPSVPRSQRHSVHSQHGDAQPRHTSSGRLTQTHGSVEQVDADRVLPSSQINPPAVTESYVTTHSTVDPPSQESIPSTNYATSFETSFAAPHSSSFSANSLPAPNVSDLEPRKGNPLAHGRLSKPRSPQRARKTSSFIRLSMNSHGSAELTAKNTSSPSPPRPLVSFPMDASGGTPISSFDASIGQGPAATTRTDLRRVPSGRSQDSRAWEFWCDKDCRSELEEKAEKDASGSAADAIQLLRSNSGRSILGPVSAKRNSTMEHGSTLKRMRREGHMPLQRSSTSSGRLQGKQLPAPGATTKTLPKLKGSKSALSVHVPGNESDKENWSPQSDLHSDQSSNVGEGDAMEDAASRVLGRRSTGFASTNSRSGKHRETIDPENDPEIAAFMKSGRESDKVSGHEELDCVQGLLSLSQGNWR